MIHRKTGSAGLLALGVMPAGAAGAQVVYVGPPYVGPGYYAPGLPPGEIIRIVRQAGFTPLSVPIRRGPNYVVVAEGRTGQMRVVINAYAGGIVSVRPVIALRPYGPPVAVPPPYYGAPPAAYVSPPRPVASVPPSGGTPAVYDQPTLPGRPSGGLGNGTLPAPSSGFPDQRLANAVTAVSPDSAGAPARAPLPRPRPNVASNDTTRSITGLAASGTSPAPRLGNPQAAPQTPPSSAKTSEPAKADVPTVPVAPLD